MVGFKQNHDPPRIFFHSPYLALMALQAEVTCKMEASGSTPAGLYTLNSLYETSQVANSLFLATYNTQRGTRSSQSLGKAASDCSCQYDAAVAAAAAADTGRRTGGRREAVRKDLGSGVVVTIAME